jgi:type IV pilus assembly protein PilW
VNAPARFRSFHGFSLVELLVAMTVGIVILGGVLTVMANSKKNYSIQDSLARLQENARFSMHFLNQDIRMAGYYGCSDDLHEVHNQLNRSDDDGESDDFFALFTENPIEGLEGEADPDAEQWYPSGSVNIPANRVSGTDAFVVRYADPNGISLVQPMPQPAANLFSEKSDLLAIGDIVLLTDCESADVFQITNLNTSGQNKDEVVHNTGGNQWPGNDPDFTDNNSNSLKLSKAYDTDSEIMKFNVMVYYIGTDDEGRRALYRQTLKTVTSNATPTNEELVDGIENMQVLYGEDTQRNDRVPDVYRPADEVASWKNVVAVRVVLLAYSQSSATGTGEYYAGSDDETYNMAFSDSASDEVAGETGDRIRRRFLTTTMLRNIK